MSASDYSKRTVKAVKLILDKCSLSFGSGACTATGTKCYNTKTTCKDVDNFNAENWEIFCIKDDSQIPSDVDAFPCLLSVTEPSTQIDERKGLAPVGTVTITLSDFAVKHDDIDPYYKEREQHGHFFRRLQAITKHFKNRLVKIKDGYILPDETRDFITTREYIITSISGPTDNNVITLTAKEPFDRLKKQIPATATAELSGAIDNSQLTFTVSGANLATEYKTILDVAPTALLPIWLKIDDEMLVCTDITSTTFTVTRGALGTAAAAHDDETLVAQVMVFDENCGDVWEELLLYSGLDSGQIDTAGMAVQQGLGLSDYDVYRVIVKQERVDVILQNLLECCISFSWWDAESQTTRIKIRRAPLPTDIVTDIADNDLVAVRPTPRPQEKLRITRCTIYTDVIDWSKGLTEKGNYYRPITFVNADYELDYEEVKERIIFAPWFGSDDYNLALSVASSTVLRYGAAPVAMQLKIEDALAESVDVGDSVAVTCSSVENSDGTVPAVQGWVTGKKRMSGNQITHVYEWLSAGFAERLWFYQPASAVGSTYSTATDEQKKYSYLAGTGGKMSDGTAGYSPQ